MKATTRALCFAVVAVACFFFGNVFANGDTIYVTEYDASTLWRLDSSGNGLRLAVDTGLLYNPVSLALDGNGNLYVGNYGNNTIKKLDTAGQVTLIADSSSGLAGPTGLAFDSAGNLFVANYGSPTRIMKFDSSGNGSVFATSGLTTPYGIAFDSSGNLFVANAHSIEKFDTNGNGSVFATSGINNARGLAFDSSGNLYVANYGNNTIQKFDPNGNGSVFISSNFLTNPWGLAFDSSGNLLVANNSGANYGLEKFDPSGYPLGYIGQAAVGYVSAIAIKQIPEPTTALLVCIGGLMCWRLVRRQK